MALCLQNNKLRPIIEHSIDSLGNCLTDWNMTMVTFSTPVVTTPSQAVQAIFMSVTRRPRLEEGPDLGDLDFPNFSGS